MAKNVTLKDLIDDLDPEIRKLLYLETRTELEKRPHVLDISYQSLLVNKTNEYTDEEFRELHRILLHVVSDKAARKFNSIDDPGIKANFSSKTPYLVYVSSGPGVQLLLAKSYDAIGNFMTVVSKDPKLVESIYGQRVKSKKEIKNRAGKPTGDYDIKYERAAQLGHIGIEDDVYFTNPLIDKLGALLDFASLSTSKVLERYVTESLNKVYKIQANIDYSFRNTTPEVLDKLESTLGNMFVVVTLQSYDVNQSFSRVEGEIFRELERKISQLASRNLQEKFYSIMSSNTILEDIEEGLANILEFGKSKLKVHSKKQQKKPKKDITKGAHLPSSRGLKLSIPKPPKQSEPTVTNLTLLQVLLNANLAETIKRNMGDGSRKNLLNLRTGRLAESAEVLRLSESRAGLITAFYTYMKNPYATFSSGGRQQEPRSRDPKLLISKSIREIAAQQVANRLRAVAI